MNISREQVDKASSDVAYIVISDRHRREKVVARLRKCLKALSQIVSGEEEIIMLRITGYKGNKNWTIEKLLTRKQFENWWCADCQIFPKNQIETARKTATPQEKEAPAYCKVCGSPAIKKNDKVHCVKCEARGDKT